MATPTSPEPELRSQASDEETDTPSACTTPEPFEHMDQRQPASMAEAIRCCYIFICKDSHEDMCWPSSWKRTNTSRNLLLRSLDQKSFLFDDRVQPLSTFFDRLEKRGKRRKYVLDAQGNVKQDWPLNIAIKLQHMFNTMTEWPLTPNLLCDLITPALKTNRGKVLFSLRYAVLYIPPEWE